MSERIRARKGAYDSTRSMAEVLVLYYSATGSVRSLAQSVARGIESVEGMRARVRTVPKVASVVEAVSPAVPAEGPPHAEARAPAPCARMAPRPPTPFRHMAAPPKPLID